MLVVLPSPQSMVMSDPLTGNCMAWSAVLVFQVVMKAWSGAPRRGSTCSAAVTRMTRWWLPPPKRSDPVAVTLTW